MAACIEAHFFEAKWRIPAIIRAQGVRPFECYGYLDLLLWKEQTPLRRLYGVGVNSLSFRSPKEDGFQEKPFIRYSRNRKNARTIFRRSSNGRNGESVEIFLQKIDDDWFVVDYQERSVS